MEILIVEIIDTETAKAYQVISLTLKAKGLIGITLVGSDYKRRLVKTAEKQFLGAFWQRLTFLFIKNVVDLVPRAKRKYLAEDLKALSNCSSKDQALNLAKVVSKIILNTLELMKC